MATPIIMPKFGQMTEESAIVEWRKKEGDKVAKGDILFTVETDKSVMEVESFEEGTLLKIVVQPGVSVPVQSTVGFLGQPGEAIPAVTAPAPAAPKPAEAEPAAPAPAPAAAPLLGAVADAPSARQCRQLQRLQHAGRCSASARARRRWPAIVSSTRRRITGTGPGGRIVEKDVKAYLEAKGYDQLRISPAAKQLAAKEKLDILAFMAPAMAAASPWPTSSAPWPKSRSR